MARQSNYCKELCPIWWEEIKAWTGWGDWKHAMTNLFIAGVGLTFLYLTKKIDILNEELWIKFTIFLAWVLWLLFIIITSFYYANRRLYDKQEKKIEDLESIINKPVSISVISDQDEKLGSNTFKQIELISQSPQELLSCFASIVSFNKLLSDGKKEDIKPRANHLIWASSNIGVENNKLILINGIPAKLYLARIDHREKKAYLAGVGPYYTPINKGTYFIQIRIDGFNFSPQIFNVTFDYDGDESIQITNISKLSSIEFLNAPIGIHNKFVPVVTVKKSKMKNK